MTTRFLFRFGLLLAVSCVPVSAVGCASTDDEDSANAAALSGGPNLAGFIAAAHEDGDIPGIKWVPAADTTFEMGRPGSINYVVIHDSEGTASSAVYTFKQPGTDSSAHYIVDKTGGAVQMVRERDIANHAFHSVLNAYAIGVEHAGYAAQNDYTREQYDASAKLVASIVTRYRIPIDRAHIVGHYQVPKTDTVVDACPADATNCGGQSGHIDPGPHWDWTLYMSLITQHARELDYAGAPADEQAKRKLTTINPMASIKFSKGMFGGYWATQCTGQPDAQVTYRTILAAGAPPHAETRYTQHEVGQCGEPKSGVYPLVFRGYPTANPSRPNLDLTGLTVEQCVDGKKRVYRYSGATVGCSFPNTDCHEGIATLESETDGC